MNTKFYTIGRISIILIIAFVLISRSAFAASGCSIHGANSLSQGGRIQLVPYPGNENFLRHIENKLIFMAHTLNIKIGDMPFVGIYNDSQAPNAYAISDAQVYPHPYALNPLTHSKGLPQRNAIVFGKNMLNRLARPVGATGLNTIEINVVLAHEFGHILQYILMQNTDNQIEIDLANRLRSASTPKIELMADVISGWTLSAMHEKQKIYSGKSTRYARKNLEIALNRMYKLGDFAFNSPNHHGTPQQRVDAFLYGFNLSKSQNITDKNIVFVRAFEKYIGW